MNRPDASKRNSLGRIWDRYDSTVGYLFIALFAVLELTSILVHSFEKYIAPQARLILLCIGLLAFFRSIDKSLDRHVAHVSNPRPLAGIRSVLSADNTIKDLGIIALDGSTYNAAILEQDTHILRLRVILIDDVHVAKWRALVDRGLVGDLQVRIHHGIPIWHLGIVPGKIAVFGAFETHAAGYTPVSTVLTGQGLRGSQELLDTLMAVFEATWVSATPLDVQQESSGTSNTAVTVPSVRAPSSLETS
jgi:hypothetical protein